MKLLYRILAWLITLLLPLALTFLGLRLLFTQAFLEVEYRTPGFPADDYGFKLQDRLKWSKVSVDYLVNNAGYFLPRKSDLSGRLIPVQPARTEPHAGCQESRQAGPGDRVYSLVLIARAVVLGTFPRMVAGVSVRPAARRLADGRIGGGDRHLRRGQLLAVLHASSTNCSFQAVPGCSSIPIHSSACSRCLSGRMPSCLRACWIWRWGWRLGSACDRKPNKVLFPVL